jgi:hypothetical protein
VALGAGLLPLLVWLAAPLPPPSFKLRICSAMCCAGTPATVTRERALPTDGVLPAPHLHPAHASTDRVVVRTATIYFGEPT